MAFKIESNVPIPKYTKGKLDILDYPLDKLKINESFVTEEKYEKASTNRVRSRINLIKARKQLTDWIFTIGQDPEQDPTKPNYGKVRVWRTS